MSERPRLRLTTPVTRLWNLPVMEADPEMLRLPDLFEVRWQILVDCFTLGLDPAAVHHVPAHPWETVENVHLQRGAPRFGEDLYNPFVLPTMEPEEWHLGIADDSLPVPGEFEALRAAIDKGADVVVFPMSICQEHHCRADATLLRPGVVSGGQVAFRRRVAGDLTWVTGNPCLDGIFVQRLWEMTGSKDPRGDRDAAAPGSTARWAFLDGPELVHNQLRRSR